MDVGALVGLMNSVKVVVQEGAVGRVRVGRVRFGRVRVGRVTVRVGMVRVGMVTVERVGRMEIGPPWGAAILEIRF